MRRAPWTLASSFVLLAGCQPPSPPPAWLDRNSGPSAPIRISSAFCEPRRAAAAMPSPISTPFTALMDIIAAARSVSSLP